MNESWDTRPPPIDAPSQRRRPTRHIIRKVLLAALAATVFCCTAAVGVVAWLALRHPEARDAGHTFANSVSQEACLPEALRRVEQCGNLSCAQAEGVFLGECLMFARPTPDLCDGVPRNAASKQAYDWTAARCSRVHAPSAYCFSVVGVLIGECFGQTPRSPAA
jgi:hypothetical protein